MNHEVVLLRLAKRDLLQVCEWVSERAPFTARKWIDRFQDALKSLEHFPARCPFAKENGMLDVELREFLFGKRPAVFRVIFTIDRNIVRILRILRAQRTPLSQSDLEQSLDN